jgi:hypothetical protein
VVPGKRKSPAGVATSDLVLSCHRGSNDEVFPSVLQLYVAKGSLIADVTFGKGVFWKRVPPQDYRLLASDLQTGIDARALPYAGNFLDAVVFDPPYMHSSGSTARASQGAYESYYRNNQQGRRSDGHLEVLALYFEAAREAWRVLRADGIYIVKTQDEVCAGRQRLTHVEIINELEQRGWICEDLLVLLQARRPGVSRMLRQLHFRKAHSYFLVFRKLGKKIWSGPPEVP